MIINLNMVYGHKRELYGLIAESEGTVRVTGSGVYNRGHAHVIKVWDSPERTGGYFVTMNAQASVISAHAIDRPKDLGTVAIGDTVTLTLDGGTYGTELVITAVPMRDPVLL